MQYEPGEKWKYTQSGINAAARIVEVVSGMTFDAFNTFLDGFLHIILPMLTLSILFIAGWSRYMRSSMIDVVKQDYIRTARAKGLREWVVVYRHALRNALIPLITVLGLSLGTLVTGVFFIEAIFNIPGIGQIALNAISQRDYPVIQATTLIGAFAVVIGNLISDLLYTVVDPRIKAE